MGISSRRNASTSLIAWPAPLKIKMAAPIGNSNASGNASVPNVAANDGSYWLVESQSIKYYNALSVLQWTIGVVADINPAALYLLGVYFDYVDAKIYALWSGGAISNTNYFMSNPLVTKSVAVNTLTTSFTTGAAVGFLDRPNGQGLGNLRYYSGDPTTPLLQYRDISTAGVLQGTTQNQTIGGVVPVTSNQGIYISTAGNLIADFYTGITASGPAPIRLMRGGSFAIASSGITNRPIVSAQTGGSLFATVNGNFMTFRSYGNDLGFPKTMLRSEFDAFLNTLADAVGCL